MNNATDLSLKKFMPALFLVVLVFIGLALLGDIRQIGSLVIQFDWRYFILALGFTLINYFLRFIKWHYFLRLLGVTNLAVRESARLFVGGFPLAVTPGKIGEALKAVWLRQKSGLPLPQGVSVVVAERLSDGLAVLGLSTLGVITFPEYWLVFSLVLLFLLSLVVLSQVKPMAEWALERMETLPLLKKIAAPTREFYHGSHFLFKPRPLAIAVGIGLVSWLGEGIGFYFILLGLGLPPSAQLAALAVFVLSFSTIIGAVSTLPGGLGAIEASIAGMLTVLGGIEPAVAATATILIRLATLWFGVLLGLLVWAGAPELVGLQRTHGRIHQG